jgi:NADH:ubiquinone reductase (H+-translocating)
VSKFDNITNGDSRKFGAVSIYENPPYNVHLKETALKHLKFTRLGMIMNSSSTLRLVIIGGGYAGLSALITLRKLSHNAHITIIDPRPFHLLITRLHETVRRPLDAIQIPFSDLAKRFNFIHKQSFIEFDQDILTVWDNQKKLQVNDETIPFDYLMISTGTIPFHTNTPSGVYDLNAIGNNNFSTILQKLIACTDLEEPVINIIGAGPTGIQFTFEIAHVLQGCHRKFRLNLIDSHEKLLDTFPTEMAEYVEQRIAEKPISVLKNQCYIDIQNNQIILKNSQTSQVSTIASDLTLLLIGNKPKLTLQANLSGQVINNNTVLNSIFTAGDCSHFDGMGSNLMTSQSAISKGKAVAKNILLKAGILKFCFPYMHKNMGYLLSLGPNDAVGWIGNKNILVKGLPALITKETIEAKYDWWL